MFGSPGELEFVGFGLGSSFCVTCFLRVNLCFFYIIISWLSSVVSTSAINCMERLVFEVGFAYPDIRYPDIRIYPSILWQPKIRISFKVKIRLFRCCKNCVNCACCIVAVLHIIAKSTAMSLFYAFFVLLIFTYFGVLKIHVLLSVSLSYATWA